MAKSTPKDKPGAKAVRFIHTADWQIGYRAAWITGDAGAVVRDARLRVLSTIGELAREQGAAFVVVAGDVFEHHGLKPDTVHKALDAMGAMGVPVYLLPGNHDAWTPQSLWRSRRWAAEWPDNVTLLGDRQPVEAPGGAWLFPCPLLERHTLDDPTEHLSPDLGPSGVVRIGVAHGGVKEILDGLRGDDDPHSRTNEIGADAARRGALDYLALGDWHSPLMVDAQTWYSGTPEATRFKERDPGQVLVVDIAGPGATPEVRPAAVGGLAWIKRSFELDCADDVDPLAAWLDGLPNKAETLVELTLAGAVDALTHAELQATLERAADRLRVLSVRADALHTFLTEDDLDGVATDGWVRAVIDRLRSDTPGGDRAAADRALRVLWRLHLDALEEPA